MLKVLETMGIQGTYLNIIKAMYSKPMVNIKLNREKLKVIPLKSEDNTVLSLHIYKRILVKRREKTLTSTMTISFSIKPGTLEGGRRHY